MGLRVRRVGLEEMSEFGVYEFGLGFLNEKYILSMQIELFGYVECT